MRKSESASVMMYMLGMDFLLTAISTIRLPKKAVRSMSKMNNDSTTTIPVLRELNCWAGFSTVLMVLFSVIICCSLLDEEHHFRRRTRRTTLSPRTRHTFKLSTISEEFVRTELKKIRSSKSTGLADTPARLLKDGSDAISRPLTVLMNRSIAEGSIPSTDRNILLSHLYINLTLGRIQTTTDQFPYYQFSVKS